MLIKTSGLNKRIKEVGLHMIRKYKSILLFIIASLLIFSLYGCQLNNNGPDGDTTINDPAPEKVNDNVIYSPSIPLNIVMGEGCSVEIAIELQEAVFWENEVMANISDGISSIDTGHTIFIGKTEAELSRKAYEILDKAIKYAHDDANIETGMVGYVYYVEGTSVAIAFSQDMYNSTVDVAMKAFIADYVNGNATLALSEGVAKKQVYNYIEFLETVDEEYYENAWSTLSVKLNNQELVESLKTLKKLYGKNAVLWLANLYDGEIGAFYYSNSGRDNVGFLPDIDSTYQAIVLVGHMGMMSDFGYGKGSYPENFWSDIGMFVKKLQDPNGYFYHPQWTKELVDSKLSRRGRDLDRAEQLLKSAGMKPTYDTPNGTKGDGLVWDVNSGGFVSSQNLIEPLSSVSTPSAVSKIVLTSTAAIADHLKSKEALEAYLKRFVDNGTNFYSVNNEIANQTSQILARDKQLAAEGANWRIAPIIIDFLNEHQNPENGTWSNNTNYNAVDGLFKAAHIYTNLGYRIPNAMAAAMTALEAITSEEAMGSIVNVYNCWSTLQIVMNNMKSFGAASDATTILEEVRKVASESIIATAQKYSEFQKYDGSFSYYKDRCSAESQGMQLALECNEGDMNATSLTYSVYNTIFAVLEIGQYKVPLHGSADFAEFIQTIENIGGVIKNPAPVQEHITFDDDTPGDVSNEVTYNFKSEGAYSNIIKDERDGANGNVLKLVSNPGAGDAVVVPVDKNSIGTCFVFEGEFCVVDSKMDYIMQINLGAAYMLNLKLVNAVDERGEAYKKIQILESSSTGSPRIERDLGISSKLGEWFKIRLEYYVGSHDSVRIKVYFNDAIAAVSDNYYDGNGTKITSGTGSPQKYYSYTQINVMASQQATILMDNLFTAKTDSRYVPEHDVNNQPLINIDPPVREEVVYNFEDLKIGKNYPIDFNVTENSGSVQVVEADGNKKLNIKASGSQTPPSIYVPAITRGPKTNCAVAEMEITVNSGMVGSALNLRLRANNPINGDTGAITAFNLEITDENKVVITEAPNGTTVSYIKGVSVDIGEIFTLRLEYYEDVNKTLIYLNGNLLFASNMLTTGGGGKSYQRLEISASNQSVIDFSVDYIKAERIVSSFEEATEPDKEELIYDFECEHTDISTNGTVVTNEGSKALKLTNGSSLEIPLNVRAVITNYISFRANTAFVGTKEADYKISFVTESGECVLSYELVSVGESVLVYEFTENGRSQKHVASFVSDKKDELKIEYYPAEDICRISYANNCIALSSINYSNTTQNAEIYKVIITSKGGNSLILDDCIFESYNSVFIEKNPVGNNDEDGAKKITFESSSTGNLPSAITKKLSSLGASVRIEEFIDRQQKATKALAFDSTSDAGGDEVAFKITDAAEGDWNVLVFEADIAFRAENLNRISYQLFFEGDTNTEKTRQYLTAIEYNGGKIKMKDYSYSNPTGTVVVNGEEISVYRNDGPHVTLNNSVDVTEWFTLRIEIYKGTRNEMRILTYVNDSLVYVTNNFYRAHISEDPNDLTDVTKVRFLALAACEATILLDNVSLSQTTKDLPLDTGNATVKLYPNTNVPK